jgi:hypothetical protein
MAVIGIDELQRIRFIVHHEDLCHNARCRSHGGTLTDVSSVTSR